MGNENKDRQTEAYATGMQLLKKANFPQRKNGSEMGYVALNEAMNKIRHATYAIREDVMYAALHLAKIDDVLNYKEREMLRALGECLECPIALG